MNAKIEDAVRHHYGVADLKPRLLGALAGSGVDPGHLTIDDLAPVDEFHIGGRAATEHLIGKLGLVPAARVLDVGCGVGGAARVVAARVGCRVTGVDLTPEFIEVARELTLRTGFGSRVSFVAASALEMPFSNAAFDAAYTMHVAMNIADRAGLYGEIARVLKSGASLGIFDLMSAAPGELRYPLPWADTPATSFLTSAEEMRGLLERAGFCVELVEDRTAAGLQFLRDRLGASSSGPPTLGIHLLMGAKARPRFENTLAAMEAGVIAPVLLLARRNGS